jgi:poly(3-hydroxyalkanoate) synthetase
MPLGGHTSDAACPPVASTNRQVPPNRPAAASLVCPPSGIGAGFRAAGAVPGEPGRWLADAEDRPGSWWTDHLTWLTARSGPLQDAPPELGGRGMHALAPAPGAYVLGR